MVSEKLVLISKLKKLAIPKMGCNLDNLSWENFMKPSILKIFDTVKMEILVCDSTQRTPRTTNTHAVYRVEPTTPSPTSPFTTLSSIPIHTSVSTKTSYTPPGSTAPVIIFTSNIESTQIESNSATPTPHLNLTSYSPSAASRSPK
jgi:hypothetical protein